MLPFMNSKELEDWANDGEMSRVIKIRILKIQAVEALWTVILIN